MSGPVDLSALSDYELVGLLPERRRDAWLDHLGADGARWLSRHWNCRARPGQQCPEGEWLVWLVMAGRGFGKTRTGAEWVQHVARHDADARVALIGATPRDAREVMVEGESGLLAIAREPDRPRWQPTRRRLVWPNGAQAFAYGASDAGSLRGPQHSHAWADEIGKWTKGVTAWDNLLLGLRLGSRPRVVATTTPAPTALVRRLVADPAIVKTHGATLDNRGALPPGFVTAMQRLYGGTRIGRQEIDGVLLDEPDGALWTRGLLERCRARSTPDAASLWRVVIGVDPPASSRGDACGIIVAGLGADGCAHVLADLTREKVSPEQWARQVCQAAGEWRADRVVAEANNGGEMVRSVLKAVSGALPIRLVHASRGKSARAEPVAALYEAGRVRHHGLLGPLEDQLCGMLQGGGYAGPGRSPDRADALVWALTELLLHEHGRAAVKLL